MSMFGLRVLLQSSKGSGDCLRLFCFENSLCWPYEKLVLILYGFWLSHRLWNSCCGKFAAAGTVEPSSSVLGVRVQGLRIKFWTPGIEFSYEKSVGFMAMVDFDRLIGSSLTQIRMCSCSCCGALWADTSKRKQDTDYSFGWIREQS